MKGRILLIEDDQNLGFVTKDGLESEGYEVNWFEDGSQIDYEGLNQYDLCLLDIMLPREDGFSLARGIRKKQEFIPIIFLTARSMEEDRLKGFEIGGDDYITKPFSLKELVYRIGVFMRRTYGGNSQINSYTVDKIGNYEFHRNTLELVHNQKRQSLTRMEAQILDCLLEKKNSVVERSEILIKVWGDDDYFKGRSLDVFISRLRKYLMHDPSIKIRNHHGVGFALQQD